MRARAVAAVAVADFRERSRRPAFLVVLLAAVGLAVVALPPADADWAVFQVGDHRGLHTSAYIGVVTATAAGFWLTLGGFLVIKNAVLRDETTRVGQVLAGTPLGRLGYAFGKWLSNVLVLATMAVLLACTALVVQLVRGESSVDVGALLLPFLVATLPLLALTGAVALVFEMVRPLRGGLGNIAWFVLWTVLATPGLGRGSGFDLLGAGPAIASIQDTIRASVPGADVGVSMGLVVHDGTAGEYEWLGTALPATYLLGRVLLVAAAVALVALAGAVFTRFDVSGAGRGAPREPAAAPDATSVRPARAFAGAARLSAPPARRFAVWALYAGELRIVVRGASRWWWLVALGVVVAGFVVPVELAPTAVLPAAWILPVLLWSRMGARAHEEDVAGLLASSPAHRSRLLAEYAAGVTVAAALGASVLFRMALASDVAGVVAWCGGALFVPALALALGVSSHSQRLFQGVYLLLWYAVVNGFAQIDFMGAVRSQDRDPTGPGPLVLVAALALLGIALLAQQLRHARR